MSYAVLERKLSMVAPQFIDELSAFVDFLLYRQNNKSSNAEKSTHGSFVDLLASAKLEEGELDLSRSRDSGRTVSL